MRRARPARRWRRSGLRVVVARAFAHTGPGQDARFVVPAFAERLRFAKRVGAPVVKVGNLEPVREFLHVRDVVDAYVRLLVRGHAGETYNVASGEGISLERLFDRLAGLIGVHPLTEADPDLVRGGDILHLVGDATLDRFGVELVGANARAIQMGEDRAQFAAAMRRIGLATPVGKTVSNLAEAVDEVAETGYPAILRPSFTLGGTGGGVAYNRAEFEELVERALELSPVHTTLIERSVLGWKEFELEVMRDHRDNVVIVCSIENVDPMGVHTGDSITVAPAMTLTDREYQRMRDAAIAIIRELGVEAGGCNIQFAVNPADGAMLVIEMNPRVSRSSALASKATGFPIARIGAKLAVGYTLDELPNDITRTTPASFEPVLDYVVVKVPRFAFEKFPTADFRLTTQMKSVGEAMAIGRTFKEALQKGF